MNEKLDKLFAQYSDCQSREVLAEQAQRIVSIIGHNTPFATDNVELHEKVAQVYNLLSEIKLGFSNAAYEVALEKRDLLEEKDGCSK